MAFEIERKFLIVTELLPCDIAGSMIRQGYLHVGDHKSVRIRMYDTNGFITVKGPDNEGVRPEFEYAIPAADAEFMLEKLCVKPILIKRRYRILWQERWWEVDEFLGENMGLWLAEIELRDRDEEIGLPPWIGQEVTGDSRYYNTFLSLNPYSGWAESC